ncbi:MAG TPA: helix-turn-helix domain-containing protein [Candidatus Gracilibacteria bacterium]
MASLEKILVSNGLSDKEAKIYLCTLEHGEISIALLAKKTGIKRTTIYNLLDDLKSKNIIHISRRKGIQYLSAVSPAVVIDQFRRAASSANEALPALINMAYQSPVKPRINFYEGLNGIKIVLREFTQSQSPPFGFTDYGNMPTELHEFIQEEVIPMRIKKKNWGHFILTNNPTNQKLAGRNETYFSENRILNFPDNQNPIELLLFDDQKVALLSFHPQERFGLIINSKNIYKTIKNIFDLLWASAR